MSIILSHAPEGPVPYIARAYISAGGVVERCPDCRRLTLIRSFTMLRNLANGPEHGGWTATDRYKLCDACLDAYFSQLADTRSEIHDFRVPVAIVK